LFGFRGLIAQTVRDPHALTLLSILIFLAPVQALDDVLISLFAVFAKARSIFVRRHLLAPAFKIAVVIALILSHSDATFLAVGYLASSFIAVLIYIFQFSRILRKEGLLADFSLRGLVLPWWEVLSFSIPLL